MHSRLSLLALFRHWPRLPLLLGPSRSRSRHRCQPTDPSTCPSRDILQALLSKIRPPLLLVRTLRIEIGHHDQVVTLRKPPNRPGGPECHEMDQVVTRLPPIPQTVGDHGLNVSHPSPELSASILQPIEPDTPIEWRVQSRKPRRVSSQSTIPMIGKYLPLLLYRG
jgi:hypothetical protein